MVIHSFLFFFFKLDAVSWENHLMVSKIEGLDICGPAIPLLSTHARAGSANLSVKEQIVNILSCVGYIVSVVTTQICHHNAKQSEAKCKLIGMLCSNKT